MKTIGISPKVIASTLVTALVGLVIAILNAVQDNPDLIPGPTWLQGVLVTIIPTVLTFLAGYRANPGEVKVS